MEAKKKEFLRRYSKFDDMNIDLAARNSIKAALQRNAIYSKKATKNCREKIRESWKKKLHKIGKEFYKKEINIEEYESKVKNLKKEMNGDFGDLLYNESIYDKGFRISHSQKSISLYLKYLWCMGEVGKPSVCPVDRTILKKSKSKNITWCYVNSIEEHQEKFGQIEKNAKLEGMSVAEWELKNF